MALPSGVEDCHCGGRRSGRNQKFHIDVYAAEHPTEGTFFGAWTTVDEAVMAHVRLKMPRLRFSELLQQRGPEAFAFRICGAAHGSVEGNAAVHALAEEHRASGGTCLNGVLGEGWQRLMGKVAHARSSYRSGRTLRDQELPPFLDGLDDCDVRRIMDLHCVPPIIL